jgi:2-methylcitrate dehydratase PrpD
VTLDRIQEGGCTPQVAPEKALELIPVSGPLLVSVAALLIGVLGWVLPLVDATRGREVGGGIAACGAALAAVGAVKATTVSERAVAAVAIAVNAGAAIRGLPLLLA